MKESLNYYYNLNIEDLNKWENIYTFKLNNLEYYFVPFNRDLKELDDILAVSLELKKRGIFVHEILPNIYNKLITNVYNTNYCLLRPYANFKEELDLPEMINLNTHLVLNPSKSNLYRISWAKLWSAKIDYFEYQISELGKDKNIINICY